MDITINVDLEKFRWSLVGDGYVREEAAAMSQDKLIEILKRRITTHIDVEYDRSFRYGLLFDYNEEE